MGIIRKVKGAVSGVLPGGKPSAKLGASGGALPGGKPHADCDAKSDAGRGGKPAVSRGAKPGAGRGGKPAAGRPSRKMRDELAELREENARLMEKLESIDAKVSALAKDVQERTDAYEAQTLPMLWDLYRREGESERDAKMRFFRSLPQATGELRRVQEELLVLMERFDEVCRENSIPYFLIGGTLIGALRHEGFVPWDDDIDVGMMRGDVERLAAAVAGDSEFEVTTVYDQLVHCKQIRFRRIGAGDMEPYVDVFPYEYSSCNSAAQLRRHKQLRERLIAALDAKKAENSPLYLPMAYVRSDLPISQAAIQAVYDDYMKEAADQGMYVESDDAESIVYGIENVSYGNSMQYMPFGDFRNLEHVAFERLSLPVLRDSERVLADEFGDWLSIPRDINTHHHIDL